MAEAGPNVGFATLQIIPSLKGVEAAVAGQLAPVEAAAAKSGTKAGSSFSSSFAGAFKAVGTGVVAFAAVGAAAIGSAIQVEDAQNIILRATGATGKAADALKTSFENVAKTTPASFKTVATALAEVSQRTGLTGTKLETLTRQVVAFNRITKDSPVNVQDLTKALAGFGIPASKLSASFDQIFKVSQKTGVPLEALVATITKAGPIFRQFGISASTTGGLLAQLDKAGIESSTAIAGLRAAFNKFAKAGVEPEEGLKKTLAAIQALLKAGDEAGANKLANQIFGGRGVGLVDAAKQGKLSLDTLAQSFTATGDGILETAKKTSTVSGKLGILSNNLKLQGAKIGLPLLESLNKVMALLVPVVQRAGPAIFGLVAAFAAMNVVTGATKAVKEFSAAMKLLNASLLSNPIFLVAAALALLGVEIVFVSKHLGNLAIVAVAAFIPFLGLPALILKNWSKLSAFFQRIGKDIGGFFARLSPTNILNELQVFPAKVAAFFKSLPALVGAALAALPSVLLGIGKFAIEALWKGIQAAWDIGLAFFRNVPGLILAAIVGIDTLLLSVGEAIIGGLYKGVVLGFFAVLQFFIDLPFNIIKATGAINEILFRVGLFIIQSLWSGIVSAWNAGIAFFKNLPRTILDLISNIGLFLAVKGAELINGLLAGAKLAFEAVKGFFRDLPSNIASVVSGAATALINIGKDLIKGIVKGIESAPNAIIDAIKKLIPGTGLLGDAASKLHLPHFQTGGVVPGSGPVLAIVHGGETIVPAGQSTTNSSNIQVNLIGSTVSAEDIFREARWAQLTGKVKTA